MTPASFRLLDLPLEIFQLVLAQAIHVRGLKRALRLRLVDRFFAVQVIEALHDFQILDNCELPICKLDGLGAQYIERRFRKNLPLPPEWVSLGRIATDLASKHDRDGYDTFLKALIRLATKSSMRPMASICLSATAHREAYSEERYSLDFLAAAAYFNMKSVVEERAVAKRLLMCGPMFGNVLKMAAKGGNEDIVEFLLRKLAVSDTDKSSLALTRMLARLTEYCSPRIVQFFIINNMSEPAYSNPMRSSLCTRNIENFTLVQNFYMTHSSLRKYFMRHAKWCLRKAASRGWNNLVIHLLSIGVPVDGECIAGIIPTNSLTMACKSGSVDTTRTLLSHGAQLCGQEAAEAAKNGHWVVVWMLVDEYSVDINRGHPPPIVSAVAHEREDIFWQLKERGAALDGWQGKMAMQKAKDDGLASMVRLFHEHARDKDDQ